MSAALDPPATAVDEVAARALAEDLEADGDVTSRAVVPEGATATAKLVARGAGILAGTRVATEIFRRVDDAVAVSWSAGDGDGLEPGRAVADVTGSVHSLLAAERSVLNVLTHCSGIATLTRAYVDAAAGRCVIRDTRKTLPGLRAIEKAAVRAGGGQNHRGSLSDAVLIKDNHLVFVPLSDAVRGARDRWPDRVVEVECDTLDQVREALSAGPDLILVDNMDPDDVRRAVGLADGRVPIEVSGGVTLATVSDYADTGADFIAVGAITHSAPAVDLALDLTTDGTEVR